MIGRLRGVLVEKRPPWLLVDVGGVGYEVEAPMSTFYDLPALNEHVTLYTHLAVKEDAHSLYGFATDRERALFRTLIRISGIGPRLALGILSSIRPDDFIRSIEHQDTATLTRLPGIGKKTAERLLLELRGKLGADIPGLGSPVDAGHADIVNALVALGYSEKESVAVLKNVPAGTPLAEGIKLALKALAK